MELDAQYGYLVARTMNFASDNAYGATPEILAAFMAANDGAVTSYGGDPVTARVQARLRAGESSSTSGEPPRMEAE